LSYIQEGIISEEISTIRKMAFYQDNLKVAFMAFQALFIPHTSKVQGSERVNPFEILSIEKRVLPGHPSHTVLPKMLFPQHSFHHA
jgi:hypothetical protein